MATLQIELEDLAGTSWWAGALAPWRRSRATRTCDSSAASAATVGTKGATFPAPRTLGTLPPQEAWAPGMTRSLQDLRREIEHDGWVEAGRGSEPWAFRYERPASRAPPGRPSLRIPDGRSDSSRRPTDCGSVGPVGAASHRPQLYQGTCAPGR